MINPKNYDISNLEHDPEWELQTIRRVVHVETGETKHFIEAPLLKALQRLSINMYDVASRIDPDLPTEKEWGQVYSFNDLDEKYWHCIQSALRDDSFYGFRGIDFMDIAEAMVQKLLDKGDVYVPPRLRKVRHSRASLRDKILERRTK